MKLLVECIFKEFCHLLKHYVPRIHLKKNLRSKNGKSLAGEVSARRIIYIENDLCEHEKIKTLIHELAHLVFESVPEKDILEIEELLWKKFSQKQKIYLGRWIPKRVSN